MAETCTVDAELFDSLQQAIDFVAERGGGVVYYRGRGDAVRQEPEAARQRQARGEASGRGLSV